jgi:hypothetical protein
MPVDPNVVAAAVGIASAQFEQFKVPITRKAVLTKSPFGEPLTFSDPIPEKVLWDKSQKVVRSITGTLVNATSTITYLNPVEVDPADEITLPDGTKPPIVGYKGFINAATLRPFVTDVYLG